VHKAGLLIQMKALSAALGHSRDQRMKPQPARLLDQRRFELPPDPLAAELRLHVEPAVMASKSAISARLISMGGFMNVNESDNHLGVR